MTSEIKILICEDDSHLRNDVADQIELDLGYSCFKAENGRVGLELAMKHKPDLIMTDIMMPYMDGFNFIAELKTLEGLQDIPIIIASAKNEFKGRLRDYSIEFVAKPYNLFDLLNCVEFCLEKQKYMSSKPLIHIGNVGGVKILICQHVRDLGDDIKRELENIGYQCILAYDREAGLKLATEHKPHLIISDVALPEMSDFGLINEFRELEGLKYIPFVVMFIEASQKNYVQNTTFLKKPFALEELLHILDNSLSVIYEDYDKASMIINDVKPDEDEQDDDDTVKSDDKNIETQILDIANQLKTDSNEDLGNIIIQIAKLYRTENYSLCQTPAQKTFWYNINHNSHGFTSKSMDTFGRNMRGIALAMTFPPVEQNKALLELTNDQSNTEILQLSIEALGRNQYSWAKDVCFKNLNHATAGVRRVSVEALGNYAFTQKTLDALKNALDDSSASVRHAVLSCLARFNRDETIKVLVQCLDNDDMLFRIDVVKALASCETRKTTQILIDFSHRETDVSVLRNIAIALGEKYRDYRFSES